MNSVITSAKLSPADSTVLAMNRGKLMKLAEGIKTKKKSTNKKSFNFKKEPGYTNIEHLVFGVYRPRTSLAASPTNRDCLQPANRDHHTHETCNSHSSSDVHQDPQTIQLCHLNEGFAEENGGDVAYQGEPTFQAVETFEPFDKTDEEDLTSGLTEGTVRALDSRSSSAHDQGTLPEPIGPETNETMGVSSPYQYSARKPLVSSGRKAGTQVYGHNGHNGTTAPRSKPKADVNNRTEALCGNGVSHHVPARNDLNVGGYGTVRTNKGPEEEDKVIAVTPKNVKVTCCCKATPGVCKCNVSSVQSIRKIAVSSSQPARPIVSTRVTVTVNTDTQSIRALTDDPCVDDTSRAIKTPQRTNIPRYSVDTPQNRRPVPRNGHGGPGNTPRHYGTDTGHRKGAPVAVRPLSGTIVPLEGTGQLQGPFGASTANGLSTSKPSRLRQPLRSSAHLPSRVNVVPRAARALSCPGPNGNSGRPRIVANRNVTHSKSETSEDEAAAPVVGGLAARGSEDAGDDDTEVKADDVVAPSGAVPVNFDVSDEEEIKKEADNSESVAAVPPLQTEDCSQDCEEQPHDNPTEEVATLTNNHDDHFTFLPPEQGSDEEPPSGAPCAEEVTPDNAVAPSRYSKELRRRKASSSPVFMDSNQVEVVDAKRSWSRVYSDRDLVRFINSKTLTVDETGSCCSLNSTPESMSVTGAVVPRVVPPLVPLSATPVSMGSNPNLMARFASMRSQPTRSPVEGVLQKFRKSFSVRFYKKAAKGHGAQEAPPTPPSPVPLTPRSRFYTSAEEGLDVDTARTAVSEVEDGPTSRSMGTVAQATTPDVTVIRFGPLVWRSSKEKKERARKDKRSSQEAVNGRPDSGSQCSLTTVTCPSTPVHYAPPQGKSPSFSHHQAPRRRAMSSSGHSDTRRPSLPCGTVTPKRSLASSVYFSTGTRRNSSCMVSGTSSGAVDSEVGVSPSCIRKGPRMQRCKATSRLRRSVSQPIELGKMETYGSSCFRNGGMLSDHEDCSGSSSSEDTGSDRDLRDASFKSRRLRKERFCSSSDAVVYGEALWDHVTMDHDELAFKAGDVVQIVDTSDAEFWYGVIGNRIGWFPASFVRLKVNQEDAAEDSVVRTTNGLLTTDQVRTNVIMEIVSTERDFVRHLKDVIQGYLKQMRKRPDMFSAHCVAAIFGNIEQIYEFQSEFLSKLEHSINWEQPHQSNIGSCFTEHREGFQVYSEYCNNHPQAVKELQDLYAIPKYAHFFEACRLLQDMIDISLDGFLLTPVQKICKYPLQLAELLKYTMPGHPDMSGVREALDAMRGVAQYINERKRRMECLEKLAAWQTTVEDWEGPHLLEKSSELIYTADASKVSVAWSRDLTLFLFDHQLVLCKRDLLKKNSYTYKGRLDIDNSHVVDVPDGRDTQTGISLKNAWKIFSSERNKCIMFAVRTSSEKKAWLEAFHNERRRVEEDNLQGFVVSESAKDAAILAVKNNTKSKRPKDKDKGNLVRGSSRSSNYMDRRSKSGSLPRSIILSTTKKKNSSGGWFHFGSNKKSKR